METGWTRLFLAGFVRNRLFCDFCFLHKDNRFGWAIYLASAALDADGNVDMGLCITFRDGTILTTRHAGATLDTLVCYNIWHIIFSFVL